MDLLNHLTGEVRVGFYQAPSVRRVVPFQIPDSCELVEVLTGGAVFFELAGVRRRFERGAMFWHLSGDSTVCEPDPSDPYRCVVFRFGVRRFRRLQGRVSFWRDVDALGAFVSDALAATHVEELDGSALFTAYVYSALLWRGRVGDDHHTTEDEYPPALRRALSFIKRHSGKSISVQEIADFSGVSKPHLFALFRRYLGRGPYAILTEKRLLDARARLAGGAEAIKTIAVECGFQNIECFYRTFKSTVGMTPGEYRLQHVPYPS